MSLDDDSQAAAEPTLSTTQAAERLHISRTTIQTLVEDGVLRVLPRLPRQRFRVFEADVEKYRALHPPARREGSEDRDTWRARASTAEVVALQLLEANETLAKTLTDTAQRLTEELLSTIEALASANSRLAEALRQMLLPSTPGQVSRRN
jgi:excisionase family DNA binding protein